MASNSLLFAIKIFNTIFNNTFKSLFPSKYKKRFEIDKGRLFPLIELFIHENILYKWSKANYKKNQINGWSQEQLSYHIAITIFV